MQNMIHTSLQISHSRHGFEKYGIANINWSSNNYFIKPLFLSLMLDGDFSVYFPLADWLRYTLHIVTALIHDK